MRYEITVGFEDHAYEDYNVEEDIGSRTWNTDNITIGPDYIAFTADYGQKYVINDFDLVLFTIGFNHVD